MSMHTVPLTLLEREGLEKHHLPIGSPSQSSDCFRNGMAWVLRHLGPVTHQVELIEAAKHIQAILHHPTRSVSILDMAKLDNALKYYEC